MARMGDKTIISPFAKFVDFYPFYLSEHSSRSNRRLHFIGTSLGIAAILHSLSTLDFRWLLGGLLAGYGCAWVGHFFIERNRPATFTYPLYSFMGDWVMWKDILTGKIRF